MNEYGKRIVSTDEELMEYNWDIMGIEVSDPATQDEMDAAVRAMEIEYDIELVGKALRTYSFAVEEYYGDPYGGTAY